MDGVNLDAVLGGDEVVQTVAEVVEAPEPQPEEKPAQPRGPDGKFAPKGEEEGVSPAPVEKAEEPAFDHAAVKGERKRRQDAEARIAALEAQLQSLQAPKEPPAPPPSLWEDEQGWQQHFGGEVVSQAVQQATLNARLDMSEMLARQANPDFEDMKASFLELMKENPSLQQQAIADPHPWNKAYQIAKNHKAMQELAATDVADLEAKIEARVREELAKQAAPAPAQPNLPQSLADAQSARSASAPLAGPLTLETILGR